MLKLFMMFYKILAIKYLLITAYAKTENSIVVDFFAHKRTHSIVGFTCNSMQEDFSLIKDLNERNIATSLSKLENTTNIHLATKTEYNRLGIFIDIRCLDTEDVASAFFTASEFRIFDELHNWLVLGNDLESILEVVDDRAFGISTDFTIVHAADSDAYTFYDVYNVFKDRGAVLNITFLAEWNVQNGLSVHLTQDKFSRRSNFHRLPIVAFFYKCTYKPKGMPLEEYYEDYEHPTKDSQSKFSFKMMSHLSDLYNFSLHPRESPQWERNDSNGPIVKALLSQTADITGTPISINAGRTYIIKFVHLGWPFRSCFMFRNPQPKKIKVKEIFKPLANETWIFMFLLFILNVAMLATTLKFEGRSSKIARYSNAILINVGALCQQGADVNARSVSTRITLLFIMIFNLIIYNYYSTSIVSTRLDESIYKINDSLRELGKLNLKMASEFAVYVEFFFKRSDKEVQYFTKNYWLKIPESKRYIDAELGFRLIKRGGFAYNTHPETAYEYIEKNFDNYEICELMEVHIFGPVFTVFAVRLNSTFDEMPRVGLKKIAEVGLRRRQILKWQHRKPSCRRDILSATSINMYEFSSYLILLLIGIILATLLCLFEIIAFNLEMCVKVDDEAPSEPKV